MRSKYLSLIVPVSLLATVPMIALADEILENFDEDFIHIENPADSVAGDLHCSVSATHVVKTDGRHVFGRLHELYTPVLSPETGEPVIDPETEEPEFDEVSFKEIIGAYESLLKTADGKVAKLQKQLNKIKNSKKAKDRRTAKSLKSQIDALGKSVSAERKTLTRVKACKKGALDPDSWEEDYPEGEVIPDSDLPDDGGDDDGSDLGGDDGFDDSGE